MESAVDRLKRTPHMDIMKVLKVSYDGLNDEEKRILLDIACLFNNQQFNIHEFKHILDASGFHAEIELHVLANKCLINKNTLRMHDLVLQMAKDIVRQESPKDPGRRSRLWNHEDIYQVLTKNTATREIEGMSLDISKMNKDMDIHPQAFAKMYNLRFLNFNNSRVIFLSFFPNSGEENNSVRLSQGLDSSFPELRYLCWYAFPLKSWQSKLLSKNLVELCLQNSKLEELWHGVQDFPNLKYFNVSFSKHLATMPDLSNAPNLERIYFFHCESLVEVHHSIQFLKKLTHLDLNYCTNLISFREIPPNVITLYLKGCRMLKYLPNNITKCKYLDRLNISDCSNLQRLPANFGNLERLSHLEAQGMKSLKELPSSFVHLNHLYDFHLSDSNLIKGLPDGFSQESCITKLDLRNGNFESLPSSIINLKKLEFLDIANCGRLQFLPDIPHSLRALDALGCRSLEDISGILSMFRSLDASHKYYEKIIYTEGCFKLDADIVGDIILRDLLKILLKTAIPIRARIYYPGSKVPEWFMFQSKGSCATFELQPGWRNEKFIGVAVSAVVYNKDPSEDVICCCTLGSEEYTCNLTEIYEGSRKNRFQSDHVFLRYDFADDKISVEFEDAANKISVEFHSDGECTEVKMFGIHFIYANDFEEPQPNRFKSL